MKRIYSTLMLLAMMVAALSFTSCSKDDDRDIVFSNDYDILEINGAKYACYGYRSFITYSSSWEFSKNIGKILLPCGKLSDAEKGEYDYDYMFTINLKGKNGLEKGCKLENFSPTFESSTDWKTVGYEGGSATVTDKQDDKWITVRFDSFRFGNGSTSYSLNGTVQLDFDED